MSIPVSTRDQEVRVLREEDLRCGHCDGEVVYWRHQFPIHGDSLKGKACGLPVAVAIKGVEG